LLALLGVQTGWAHGSTGEKIPLSLEIS
jgi:hypothetical protein